MIDDDLAYVAPWGFAPEQVSPPVLFLDGGQDRIAPNAHARWLAQHVPSGELRLRPDDGHISVLSSAAAALDWLRNQTTEPQETIQVSATHIPVQVVMNSTQTGASVWPVPIHEIVKDAEK